MEAAGAAPVAEGRVVAGRLRLDTKLAAGSMGEVWRARHLGLDKDVAVKLLRPDHRLDGQVSRRFIREARTASKLDHPNSVSILDFGRDDSGLLYLAMELISGHTLSQTLRAQGPYPLREAARIMARVLAAVAAAHAAGVLHRDIKPSNIMLAPAEDDDGKPYLRVKVCDFGLAKLVDASESLVGGTGPRGIVGTPLYMSPEQAVGAEVDERTDIYACGVVLFEMLTGHPPYAADRAVAVLMQHCSAPIPSARSWAPHLPAAIDELLARALAKEAEDRFASARAFRSALAGAVASAPEGDAPAPSSRPRLDPLHLEIESPIEADAGITTPAVMRIESSSHDRRAPNPVAGRSPASASRPFDLDLDGDAIAESIIPAARKPSTSEAASRASSLYLWERYALSPHRRPPPSGFYLLGEEAEAVGPLTFEELCIALRLEAHDGSLDGVRVSADPRPSEWRTAPEFLHTADALGVRRLGPEPTHDIRAQRGDLDLMTVSALLVRAELEQRTGRFVFESVHAGAALVFEVHLVSGRPTHVETNELALQTPAVWIDRVAVEELDLPRLVHDAWLTGTSLVAAGRRLLGVDLEEQRPWVMRRRLRRLVGLSSGSWVFEPAFEPAERRPIGPGGIASILPRLVREGLTMETLTMALAPHLDQTLATLPGMEFLLDLLGFSSKERTTAEELLATDQLGAALSGQGERLHARAAIAFTLIASSSMFPGPAGPSDV